MLTARDSSGMTPLHQCVSTGTAEVLDALLRPICGGRGEFTPRDASNSSAVSSNTGKTPFDKRRIQNKRVLRQELVKNSSVPGHEWFDVGAVYNLLSGQEVISLDHPPMGIHSSKVVSSSADAKLSVTEESPHISLGETVDDLLRSSYNLMSGTALSEAKMNSVPVVDYEVIVPWLVRNIHKRSTEMGGRLGATGTEILDELIDIVDITGTRSLVLPEINKFLGLLGIVVTRDVVKELCHMYPASIDAIEEKWAMIRDQCAQPKDGDLKSSQASGGKASSKGSKKGSRRSRDTGDSDDKFGEEGEGKGSTSDFKRNNPTKSPNRVRDDAGNDTKIFGQDEEFGLDFDKLVDDIMSGRGMRSAVTSSTSFFGSSDKKESNRDETAEGVDDIAELTQEQERSILESNCGVELPPVLTIASILKCRRLVVNVRDEYGNTPVLLATALNRRYHVDILLRCGADISILSNEGHSPLAVATDPSIISSLQKQLVVMIKKSKATVMKHGFVSALDANTALVNTQTSGVNTEQLISRTCGDSESLLVQLQGLQKKKWGYSQGSLMWALESGTKDTIEKLLLAGADPNETDVMGRTVLHECMAMATRIVARDLSELEVATSSIFALRSIAEALILAGADVNRQTSSGRTPLHELFCKGHENENSSFPSRNTKNTINKTLTKLSRSNDEIGHFRAVKKSVERLQSLLVRSLLQWGANALALDRHGYCPMFYCARENMPNCMIEILKANVDVYYKCPRGRTALHIACINGSAEVASLICKWDADNKNGVQLVRDSGGKVPRDLIFGMSALSLTTLWQACREGNSIRYVELMLLYLHIHDTCYVVN